MGARATMGRRPMHMAIVRSMGTTPVGSTAHVPSRICTTTGRGLRRRCTTATVPHHRPWRAITAVLGPTTIWCAAPTCHRSTVRHVMWCMTGAATVCSARPAVTIGCITVGTTCWWLRHRG